ncbi:hypothetical protein FOL47_002125, partial [Perkinsus chesapeaki]
MVTITRYTLLCIIGAAAAFKLGAVRMQTKSTRYCNPNLIGPDKKPVECHISKAEETKGLVYPGMDDGKPLTTHHDTFVTKDGQVQVGASPERPYEYTVTTETITSLSMIQLFNFTSYPVADQPKKKSQELFSSVDLELTLEEIGWAHHGLVHVNGDKLHKYIIYGANGTEPKTDMNFTALAMTGLIPNAWVLYTDEADEEIVKIQAINTFQNDMVYQEDVVTHWEKLPNGTTTGESMKRVYSAYGIKKHETTVPPLNVAPRPEAILIGSELTGELTRLYFNDGKTPDWMPHGLLRGSNGSDAPIEYFKIEKGAASQKFFLAKYGLTSNEAKELELPPNCAASAGDSKYCLHVKTDYNDTILEGKLLMKFTDVQNELYNATLKLSIVYSLEDKSVLEFDFEGGGCAVVFQAGVSLGNVNVK